MIGNTPGPNVALLSVVPQRDHAHDVARYAQQSERHRRATRFIDFIRSSIDDLSIP